MFNGKIHYKSPFSIAMLNYQRVTIGPWTSDYIRAAAPAADPEKLGSLPDQAKQQST